jgi:Spy/CpxP family protein refolding chaperone
MTSLLNQVHKLKQSYHLKPLAVVVIAAAMGSFSTVLPAQSDNQSSEMRDLVRQSQGLSPAKSGSDSDEKKHKPSTASDPAAIYIQAGASAEQADKIRELRKNLEKQNASKATELFALFKEMHGFTTQAELDETKILTVQEKINALQSEMGTEKTRTLISIRKILTSKQRENLVEIIRKRSNAKPESAH